MYIPKVNSLNFMGSVRFTTKPDCKMETHDVETLQNFRPARVSDRGNYVGCAFDVDGNGYITTRDNDIPFIYYSNIVLNAAKSPEGTFNLEGFFNRKNMPDFIEPDNTPVPAPDQSPIAGIPADYPKK